MDTKREVTCGECGTKLPVEDVAPGQVKVETSKLPEECCQRAATNGHKLMGVFVANPEAKA